MIVMVGLVTLYCVVCAMPEDHALFVKIERALDFMEGVMERFKRTGSTDIKYDPNIIDLVYDEHRGVWSC